MALIDDLKAETDEIVSKSWDRRDAEEVPALDSLALGNQCVEMEATFLYADLANSTKLAISEQTVAAEVAKAYLRGSTRIIRALAGEIRSFDGDRVMAVFFEGPKNTNAVEAALKINHFFRQVLVPSFTSFYKSKTLSLNHGVGIDTSKVMVVRSGIRDNNDLVWIGRAPNIAAKLSSVRLSGCSIYISETVFKIMLDTSKYRAGTSNSEIMWEPMLWPDGAMYGMPIIYKSGWMWKP